MKATCTLPTLTVPRVVTLPPLPLLHCCIGGVWHLCNCCLIAALFTSAIIHSSLSLAAWFTHSLLSDWPCCHWMPPCRDQGFTMSVQTKVDKRAFCFSYFNPNSVEYTEMHSDAPCVFFGEREEFFLVFSMEWDRNVSCRCRPRCCAVVAVAAVATLSLSLLWLFCLLLSPPPPVHPRSSRWYINPR